MKKFLPLLFLPILVSACNTKPAEKETQSEDPLTYSFSEVWRTDTVMATPESVKYDPNGDVLYVANINGMPLDKDGNGFISKLATDGSVIELEWATGFDAPKGMGIYEGTLYVTDIDHVRAVDMTNGSIKESYFVEGSSFLNDITIDKDGKVFISDMRTGKVHTLANGVVSDWITEDFDGVNGLYDMGEKLIVNASGKGEVRKVHKETMEYKVLATGIGGDGVEYTGMDGVYVVSEWKGKVHVVTPDSTFTVVDTEEAGKQTADIGFNKKEMMVYVPTFFDNRVVAYKLVKE